jgi:hypothetical protein
MGDQWYSAQAKGIGVITRTIADNGQNSGTTTQPFDTARHQQENPPASWGFNIPPLRFSSTTGS